MKELANKKDMKKPKSYKEATKTNNFLKVGLVGLVTGWRFELVTASGGIYRHKAVTKLVVGRFLRLPFIVCEALLVWPSAAM